MSVWKKVDSKVLSSGVDLDLLKEVLLKDFSVELDFDNRVIMNTWGREEVDCSLVHKGVYTSLGFKFTEDNGVRLLGDIFASGLGCDGDQEALMNKISQAYQKENISNKLMSDGWNIENIDFNENNEIVLDMIRY